MRISGDRFDYSSERQRHEKFLGRAALLARLDQLLVDSKTDRWVVITGGPGMGKSALLAAWLARRTAIGALVPHHFIRRGAYDWDDPAKLVGSLVAQIEDSFPDLHEQEADNRMHPATRLARALSRVSQEVLRPRGKRLVVLIDGLDEYDPPVGSSAADPLAAFLPDALPAGVRLLCASRPRHPYVSSLEARDGALVQIDLDDPDNATDNDATVRAFWESAAEEIGLDANFVDKVVARAGGNVQHAVQLRKHLVALPPEYHLVEDIPRGLAALIEKSWGRIAVDTAVVDGLGILCAAREALTLDELGSVAGWTSEAQRRAFVHGARELLVEAKRPDGQPEYRLHHDSIRTHIARAIGAGALGRHHAVLAQRLATWPAPLGAASRRYALRHALIHRAEAGDWDAAWRIVGDMSFLEAKCREIGVHETEADVARTAERCRASGDATVFQRISDIARVLARESHSLRLAPEATAALVWNRLRRWGWSAADLDVQLWIPLEITFLRVWHVTTRESPALVRDLVGHSAYVNACVVTVDGRRAISASSDKTLRVWDLESGRALATLDGHASSVSACAVTPDGQRVVSASDDGMLKLWNVERGYVLATLKGHLGRVNACVVTPDGQHVVSASDDGTLKFWDVKIGYPLATLKGHLGRVNACALTANGRRVISASDDGTLKVWDVERGYLLATLNGHLDRVNACALTADGRRVISASDDGTLKVWDVERGYLLATLKGHDGCVNACALTPDGGRLVSASHDGTLKVWHLQSGSVLATLEGHAGRVTACALTADGRRMVSASQRTLKIWDLENDERLGDITVAALCGVRRLRACAVTADGRRMVSVSDSNELEVCDPDGGRVFATLRGHIGRVNACTLTTDGRCVISASDDRTLKVWDLETGCLLATLEGHTDAVTACAVTADGRRVVSISEDQTLKVWDLSSGHTLATLRNHTRMRACAVTADGRRAVTADSRQENSISSDRTLMIWDLENGRSLATLDLEGHTDEVTACAVTADGRRVISASMDKTLKIWDLESGRVLATLRGHTDGITACALMADGRRVVSASIDWTLRVWDLETYVCLLTHRGDAHYYAVAAGVSRIVAGDGRSGFWVLDWQSPKRNVKLLHLSDGNQRESLSAHPLPPTRQLIKKHTILFLAANPLGTDRFALDREARAIYMELKRSGYRDCFELITRWAAEPLDLLRELRELKPTVVHFSGHGGQNAAGADHRTARNRDITSEASFHESDKGQGLFFQGPDGRAQFVSVVALMQTFGAAGSSVKLVVLNACYSEAQATALAAHVDCVVGMGGSIQDDAARKFAIGFYGGLGACESVSAAYQQGRAAISLEGLSHSDRPQLKVRDGVDANQLVLAADPL